MLSQAATAPDVAGYAGVARVPFLMLPVTLVAVGTAAAFFVGAHDWLHAGIALVGMLAVHVAVNALNEASDYRRGIDLKTERTPFSGGSGTLPAGRLTYGKALATGLVSGVIGVVVGIYFLAVVGWTLLPILVLGAVAVFTYTEVLARLYVGELFAGLGLGCLPVIGTALVLTGNYEPVAIVASLPAFFMTLNLLFLNEFPDVEPDREGGRRNLVLLLGRRNAARLYCVLALLVPASLIAGVLLSRLPVWSLAATLPSAALLPAPFRWALSAAEAPVPIPALGANVIWNLTTNLVLAASLFVAALA